MQEYNNIDQQIHQLCQTIAKLNRSFVPPKADDSHTNLSFDFLGKKVWGRWANLGDQACILGLDLPNQHFQLYDKTYQPIASFDITGKTQSSVEQDIAKLLRDSFREDGEDFLKALHFEIPDYSFAKAPVQKWAQEDLKTWMAFRHLANQSCALFVNHLNSEAEIRIWPHHFDTGIYVEPQKTTGIGMGWAMADSMIPEAYYYFSVYGLDEHQPDYSTVKPLSAGKWIIGEDWKGAVLPLKDVSEAHIRTYLLETVQWALS